ncbi:PIN-like domain-containing protein [Nocardia sp. NPDC058499]|uniref:PIN-like domain-containing protein n=1 Tax=Nocardia sp. NPDC058499 TaxID=3346530 RepID=UPI00365C4FA4
MKFLFREWYGPEESEIEDYIRTATIALDANVLLAPYRVGSTQRTELMDALRAVSERIWVPYQAALEYQRNRLSVAEEQQLFYDSIEKIGAEKFDTAIQKSLDELSAMRSRSLEVLRDAEIKSVIASGFDESIEQIRELAKRRKEAMKEAFSALRRDHAVDFNSVRSADPIRAEFDSIFVDGRVGFPPDPETLNDRIEQAEKRIAADIPPGFKDKKKNDATGDCLIWFELLEYAKQTKRPILYVTNDVKDSFERVYGQRVGPRVELRAEMLKTGGQPYHQTTVDGFLHLAKKYLRVSISDDTIDQYKSRRVGGGFAETDSGALLGSGTGDTEKRLEETAISDGYDTGQFRVADLLEQELAELQAERRKARAIRDRATVSQKLGESRKLGIEAVKEGKYGKAVDILAATLSEELAQFDRVDSGPMKTQRALVDAHMSFGHHGEAEALAEDILREHVNRYGPDDKRTMKVVSWIAEIRSNVT